MSMFFLTDFDRNLENATSHLKLDPDWETILLIADGIRQNDVTPKHAIAAIRKKMASANPHTAAYALLVLESIVKNCGQPVHDEICTRESAEWFQQFIETTPHETVKAKSLELLQAWAFAFRAFEKYQAIRDIVTILKQKGHRFPELSESDAMFTAETAPDWSDGKVCSRCRVVFSFTQRKHHCRNCGKIFCAQCSAKTCTLPKFGIEKEVRVCDGCFAGLHSGGAGAAAAAAPGGPKGLESDLPAEYLASTLAQQSQQPPRKSEQELKEEEELQLALALSQSEAEAAQGGGGGVKLGTAAGASYRALSAAAAQQQVHHRSPEAPRAVSAAAAVAPMSPAANLGGELGGAYDRASLGSGADPELAKYMNRDYWEQRGKAGAMAESPASPSAPSPAMSQISGVGGGAGGGMIGVGGGGGGLGALASLQMKTSGPEDAELAEFSASMRTQVEIFVNRMRSNSSRGRNIVTDSAVQTLFCTLTSYHSRLLTYIKDLDDRRQWYEQLQDKIAQVKDSRAALDVLRQEHRDRLRLIAEEQERQRQQMLAHKLDIMRKKKQESLQFQRQMALQRIQEQEREMALRQEQQKAMYQMGGVGGMQFMQQQQVSPMHQQHQHPNQQQTVAGSIYGGAQMQQQPIYGMAGMPGQQQMMMGMGQQQHPQQMQMQPHHEMYLQQQQQQQQPQMLPQMPQHPMQQQQQQPQIPGQFGQHGGQPPLQQQQQHPAAMMAGVGLQQQQQPQQQPMMINNGNIPAPGLVGPPPPQPIAAPVAAPAPVAPDVVVQPTPQQQQPQVAAPVPAPVPIAEPAEAELISFD